MATRNERPFRFNPRSLVDALDGGQVPPGGLQALTDLIFDTADPGTFECRPAAVQQSTFSGISSPGVVSVAYVVGSVVYGMIGSSLVAGYDQPFAFNLSTNLLVSVSGTQSSSTLPATQSTAGDWVPPTMALVGVLLYVTHPGFNGSPAFFGWFDTTNPAAPVWHSGNTGVTALPYPPLAVAQYNNRAWFAVKNTLGFTDTLSTNISDATHFITVGDSVNITALAPQPITTSVQGVIQALVAFKPSVISMITGDAATNDLAQNIISSSVGCVAPRTVSAFPKGIIFMANDGIRTINQQGTLTDPNPDLQVPFVSAVFPSRASAGYNNNVYRISVQNGHISGNPTQEFWFDVRSNGWTGPHSFVQTLCCPYSETFVAFSDAIHPALFTSDVMQSGNSTFTENGSAMSFVYQTAPLADDGGMYHGSAILSVIDMELPANGYTYTFAASDVAAGAICSAIVTAKNTGNEWNYSNWGTLVWTNRQYGLDRYNIPWPQPLVFTRLVFQANGPSSPDFKIGKLTVGNQPLRYVRTP